jgi:ppGpp synthetase/RelA/SpoT-type nucleotidyltranferase
MSFCPVPKAPRREINRAGKILIQEKPDTAELLRAIQLAEQWRACHAYPINTFQANLRTKLNDFPRSPLAAQRLKRMPTIVDKLKRFPSMDLAAMQDIGGVRAIMGNVGDVEKLTDYYRNSRIRSELVNQKNYIMKPKDDGYRGIHLIYKYENYSAPRYNGLRIELQIRTKMQHDWATAVETIETLLHKSMKSRQGDKNWSDFFAIVASAIAYRENRPLVPEFQSLNQLELYEKVVDAEAKVRAIETMKACSTYILHTDLGARRKSYYNLIVLNYAKRKIHVKPYDRNSSQQAIIDYGKVEAIAARGKSIEPVLVAAGPISVLRRAYPNLFFNINDFIKIVQGMLREAKRQKKYRSQIPLL